MKVVALQGQGNRGKSTVLAALYAELRTYKGVTAETVDAPLPADVIADIAAERKARRQGAEYKIKDFSAVLDMQGRRIGICTAGDTEEAVLAALDYLTSENCDIGFCAVRSKGKAVHALKAFARRKHTVDLVQKAIIENAYEYPSCNDVIDLLNDWQVKKLLEYLK